MIHEEDGDFDRGPTGQGQKVINEMITFLYKLSSAVEIIIEAFSRLYRAFITVINSLDSPDNMLTNNALYP